VLTPCLQDRFNLGPEVREKRCGIGIGVEADALSCVFMIEFDASLGSGTGAFADRVSVVESEEPVAVFVVERERVVQPVGSLGGFRNLFDYKLDPAFSVGLRYESLAVEQQERVEAGIADFHCLNSIIR